MFDILCRCVIYMQYTYMSVYIYIYISRQGGGIVSIK